MEDSQCNDEQRVKAIESLQEQMRELNQWTNYYSKAKNELVRLNELSNEGDKTVEPRRSKRQQELQDSIAAPTSKEVKGLKSRAKFEQYSEYDKTHQASQQEKRRVHFEAAVIEAPKKPNKKSDERVQRYEAKAKVISKPKGVTPKQSDLKADVEQSERAKAEAKRRGVDTTNAQAEEGQCGLFQDPEFTEEGKDGITVYRDDKYTKRSRIDEVSDFTLSTFLMENKVGL
jgi:hypothetical protein